MLRNPTPQAEKLAKALTERGLSNEKEHYDGHKHVDICIPSARLNIEVDGIQHTTNADQIIADFGREHYSDIDDYATLHITNQLIDHDVDGIARAIQEVAERRVASLEEARTRQADFFQRYLGSLPPEERKLRKAASYGAWGFGVDKEFSERLIRLVLDGQKKATAGLLYADSVVPKKGDVGMIIDHRNQPRCLIEYVDTAITPFKEIDLAFAQAEGEGYLSLQEWRDEHRRVLFADQGVPFSEDSLLLLEYFKVVFTIS